MGKNLKPLFRDPRASMEKYHPSYRLPKIMIVQACVFLLDTNTGKILIKNALLQQAFFLNAYILLDVFSLLQAYFIN
jgi:hypothetical protein